MPRRYHDVEMVPLAELRPGDRIAVVRTVAKVVATVGSIWVELDDGTAIDGDPTQEPAVEIVARKEE